MATKVALVNMPFGFHVYPSIQLGTLSTLLKTHGHPVKSFYLNLHFAHQIDMEVYNKLCEERSAEQPMKYRLEGAAGKAFAFCNEAARSMDQMHAHLKEKGETVERSELESIIKDLEDKRLMVGERGKYLNLALPHNSHL